MKTTIETINNKLCTVIRRPFDAEWVKGQLAMGVPVRVREVHGVQWAWVFSENNGRYYSERGERLDERFFRVEVAIEGGQAV